MTYGYDDATAVLGPLAPVRDPSALELCEDHARTVTVPRGWTMIRLADHFEPAPPSTDDLMALADAIRNTSAKDLPEARPAAREVGRPLDSIEIVRARQAHPASAPRRPRLAIVPQEQEGPVPAESDGDNATREPQTP